MTQPSTRRRPQGPTGSTRRSAGFTLIELMIAVAIVGILASIAYPSYQKYVIESRRTDARALLMRAAGELERCFTVVNDYKQCYLERGLADWSSENSYYKLPELDEDKVKSYSYTLEAKLGPNDVQRGDSACLPITLSHLGERNPDACW